MPADNYINSINLNKDTDFPYLVLDVTDDHAYPRNPGFQVMHWHEDLQFIYVSSGTIEVRTLDHSVFLHPGDGIFINKNIIHHVRRLESCHYNSFIFPEYFLEFYMGSPLKKFVEDITTDTDIALYPLTDSVPWQKDALYFLQQLAALENHKTEFYSYDVLTKLSALWLIICKNIQNGNDCNTSSHVSNAVQIRTRQILQYIDAHYSEEITLSDLAGSANISKSECGRCFQLCLDTTPYKYLLEFRLSKAAKLLKETDLPVGIIAENTGFHQMSHFGKCFKEKTGHTPREYRSMNAPSSMR